MGKHTAWQPSPVPCLEHKLIQHRDAKPPWCAKCGRTADGRHHDDIKSRLDRRQKSD